MSERPPRRGFATRPGTADAWVRAPDRTPDTPSGYTARLTIDVTPALRGAIKIIAYRRGITVADMLRMLLEREFGAQSGDQP